MMRRLPALSFCCAGALLAGAASNAAADAPLGTIRSLSGADHAGALEVAADGIRVAAEGAAVTVRWDQIASLRIDAAAGRDELPRSVFSHLPSPWRNQNVGRLGKAGSAFWNEDGKVRVEAPPSPPNDVFDAFHFVCRPAGGTVQITARVTEIDAEDAADVHAGLIFATGVTEDDERAFVALRAGDGACLRIWGRRDGSARELDDASLATPCWIRLVRGFRDVGAQISADGESWTEFASARFEKATDTGFIGVAVMNGGRSSSAAVFHDVRVEQTNGWDDGAVPLPHEFTRPKVILRSGSQLMADPVSAGSGAILLETPWARLAISSDAVARIEFRVPLGEDEQIAVDGSRPGALLRSGDFLEGSLGALENTRSVIASDIFGQVEYFIPNEIDALVFHPVSIPPPQQELWTVTTADGSEIHAASLAAHPEMPHVLCAATAGPHPIDLAIPFHQVTRIDR